MISHGDGLYSLLEYHLYGLEQERTNPFANGSELKLEDPNNCTFGVWGYKKAKEGIKRFIKKALGSKNSAMYTLDELAQLFCETKIASSLDEGKEITHYLEEKISPTFGYLMIDRATGEYGLRSWFFSLPQELQFRKVRNALGEKRYKVSIFTSHGGM